MIILISLHYGSFGTMWNMYRMVNVDSTPNPARRSGVKIRSLLGKDGDDNGEQE